MVIDGLLRSTTMAGSRPWIRWLAAIVGVVLLLLGTGYAGPSLPFAPMAAFIIGFSAVAGESLLVALLTPRASPWMLLWLPVPLTALWLTNANEGLGLAAAATVTAALLMGGTLLGSVVGSAIEHPGQLGFVAIASAAADLFSVWSPSGVSASIIESPPVLSVVSLPWPMFGTDQVESMLGGGDIVFAALYIAAARAHGLGIGRTALALAGAFACTLLALLALEEPVPALPFLGAAIVLVHPQARRPADADALRGGLGVVALAIALAVWFLASR